MSSNTLAPDDISYQLIVFISIFTPLEVGFVALRFYARSLTAGKLGPDDWLILAALLSQIVATILVIGGIKQGGFGRHIGYLEETNPEAIIVFFKYLVAIAIWYHFTVSFAKFAICLLYRRLFPQKAIHIVLYATMAVMIATSVTSVIIDFVSCKQFSENWAPPAVQNTECFDKEPFYVWSTFPNIITDIVMLVLPIRVVWSLQVSRRLKVALAATFLIGGIGLAASISRFAAFANHSTFVDATYTAVMLCIWTIAEPGIYLIAACSMMLRPLFDKVKAFGTRTGSERSIYPRSAFGSRPKRHRSDQASERNGKSILLSSRDCSSGRFEQFHTENDGKAGPRRERDQYGRNDIVVTTEIQSTRDHC